MYSDDELAQRSVDRSPKTSVMSAVSKRRLITDVPHG